ncbi:glycine oxidase ThiO [Chamaesiphon polymorphus]|uniref:glycine oxidase n=1 Tax=Chamaesiphon polymorphus CCALA 037 TaxID=2107692 RepID=A0A2T1F5A3_9CYAN|nr:glycine oxidase ThiO [Chamaesiphon polymorphus]PSB40185.1 glycine oxidase ThiO [Chamaesiphon polymorphus CCALA 037]
MQPGSEIIVIGGGTIGLATAIELRLLGAAVTILCKDFKSAAAHAAAGMLAPQAERIEPGAMLDLCLASRDLYPEWIGKIESISGVDSGYWPCGILAPSYTQSESPRSTTDPLAAEWLDTPSIHRYQSGLGESVLGGYWYPAEGQVDNRALMRSLYVAAQAVGANFLDGVEVTNIHYTRGRVRYLETNRGQISAQHYILATGAWSQQLIPIPIVPRKGQMLSVVVPPQQRDNLPLQRVLFGEEIYIVPRQDGRIIVGATSEDVGFAPHNTLQGVKQLMTNAMRLFPPLQNCPLHETWWGYRPATPDELPILGRSSAANLTLATGHYRNGILLTPITAKLIADLVWHKQADNLLAAFSWQRFEPC